MDGSIPLVPLGEDVVGNWLAHASEVIVAHRPAGAAASEKGCPSSTCLSNCSGLVMLNTIDIGMSKHPLGASLPQVTCTMAWLMIDDCQHPGSDAAEVQGLQEEIMIRPGMQG